MHHKTVVPCEFAWTVTAVLPVDLFILSLQRRRSCFFTSNSRTQQRSVDYSIPDMEEEEEEGGGGVRRRRRENYYDN